MDEGIDYERQRSRQDIIRLAIDTIIDSGGENAAQIAELLFIVSLFYHEYIPQEQIIGYIASRTPEQTWTVEFPAIKADLQKHYLITKDMGSEFAMHQYVSHFMGNNVKPRFPVKHLKIIIRKFSNLINVMLGKKLSSESQKTICIKKWINHGEKLINIIDLLLDPSFERNKFNILLNLAMLNKKVGVYYKSQIHWERLLSEQLKEHGEDHKIVALCRSALAAVLITKGQYIRAEKTL